MPYFLSSPRVNNYLLLIYIIAEPHGEADPLCGNLVQKAVHVLAAHHEVEGINIDEQVE